jgi:hypothetical protein
LITEQANEIEDALAGTHLELQQALQEAKHSEAYSLADRMAFDFEAMMDHWHSQPETWDTEIDTQLHKWYTNPPKLFPKKPYFSPSATGDCPRAMYEKSRGSKKDTRGQAPHQGRWTRLGTAIGDMLQRDILFVEKFVKDARFKFERTPTGEPMFEDFAKASVPVKYRNKLFYLFGSPDGVMEYITDDGEIIRVGLEIKSKQTTYAQTGNFSMKTAEAKHVEQTKVYAMMYNLDYFLVVYVNASKKSWNLTDEDSIKYPDLRAHGQYFTREDKLEVLDMFVETLERVERVDPPLPDLSKWTFNGFKSVIADALSDEDMATLEAQVVAAKASSMKAYMIRGMDEAFEEIKQLRGGK